MSAEFPNTTTLCAPSWRANSTPWWSTPTIDFPASPPTLLPSTTASPRSAGSSTPPDYPSLLVVSGQSAGAGIAASLVHKAHDTHTGPIAFQLLFEPMLDNATTRSTGRGVLCWGMITNILGWRAYLRGATKPLDYAVPARRADLRGLPPAFIAVGDLDLFYNEDAAYAHRLTQAEVPTRFYTMKGTYHGTLIRCLHTSAMQTMWAEALAAVRQEVG